VELPLTLKNGYGPFKPPLISVSLAYSDEKNKIWISTQLKTTGAPKNWTDLKFGDIETNIYQTIYQNYLIGNITEDDYIEIQKSWEWKPDTLNLSKKPLKCKIAFAYGTDENGTLKMVVDANNNLDFSDDKITIPEIVDIKKDINKDSLALINTINVTFETFANHKQTLTNAPVLIVYNPNMGIFLYNVYQHATTTYKGEEIAVSSYNFSASSFRDANIVLKSKKNETDVNQNAVLINEYIEIKGVLHKNNGYYINKNTLILEKVNLIKSNIFSSQVGFNSYPFVGEDFKTNSLISLKKLKGKYIILDFWATWCGPCRKELPNLKKLYEKIDKSKIEIIGIVGDSPLDALNKLMDEQNILWPQIISTEVNNIKNKFGIKGYPTTFLINPEGVIIAKDLTVEELDKKLSSLTIK